MISNPSRVVTVVSERRSYGRFRCENSENEQPIQWGALQASLQTALDRQLKEMTESLVSLVSGFDNRLDLFEERIHQVQPNYQFSPQYYRSPPPISDPPKKLSPIESKMKPPVAVDEISDLSKTLTPIEQEMQLGVSEHPLVLNSSDPVKSAASEKESVEESDGISSVERECLSMVAVASHFTVKLWPFAVTACRHFSSEAHAATKNGSSSSWSKYGLWKDNKPAGTRSKPSIHPSIRWTDEQNRVLDAVRNRKSIFITGSAGTGKTFLLEEIIKEFRKIHGESGVYVTASTGLAACALHGQTLHSFAGVGCGELDREGLLERVILNGKACKRWKEVNALVIDETSMVGAEIFDGLAHIARDRLEICIDARVMLIKNINPASKLVNGATGTVLRFEEGVPFVRFDSGIEMLTDREQWLVKVGDKIVASGKQIPLILAWALSIHGTCAKSGYGDNTYVGSALVDMYASALLAAYARAEEGHNCMNLFTEMKRGGFGCQPNEVTFLCVLNVRSHSGLLDKGMYYFDLMKKYKLEPDITPYVAVVNLLARAGMLVLAERFIRAMPNQPTTAIWKALLGACKMHGSMELDVDAAEKIGGRVVNVVSAIERRVVESGGYRTRMIMSEKTNDGSAGIHIGDIEDVEYLAAEDYLPTMPNTHMADLLAAQYSTLMTCEGYHMEDLLQPKPVRMNSASGAQPNTPGVSPTSAGAEMQQYSDGVSQASNDATKSAASPQNMQGQRMLPPESNQAIQMSQGLLLPGVSVTSRLQQEQLPHMQWQVQQQHQQFQGPPVMFPTNSMQHHLTNIAQTANMHIKLPTANFDQKIGVQIIHNALKTPAYTIASTAGVKGVVLDENLCSGDDGVYAQLALIVSSKIRVLGTRLLKGGSIVTPQAMGGEDITDRRLGERGFLHQRPRVIIFKFNYV